jgi:AraC-like DNA-binding protein
MNHLINPNNYEHTNLEDINFPFNIFRISSTTPPHWHMHTEFIYILEGSASIYINGTLFQCTKGEIVFVPNSSLHTIVPDEKTEYYAMVIGDTLFHNITLDMHYKEYIYPFFQREAVDAFAVFRDMEFHWSLKTIIDDIIYEATSNNKGYQANIKADLCKFFIYITRYIDFGKKSFDNSKNENIKNLKKVFDFVDKNYSQKITVSDMSELINFSQQHFCRIFKAYTGKTFIEYITLIRLDKARELIVKTDITITQISSMTGFCTPNYFNRIFKKYFGYKPSDVRK